MRVSQSTCKLSYYLKNLGPGPIPYDAWDKKNPLEIGILRNGRLWGAEALYRVDPLGLLADPNPNLQKERETGLVISDQHPEQITLLVDRTYRVDEADEKNSYTQMLTCPRADLVVRRVYLDGECHVLADIENAGSGKLDLRAYTPQGMAHVQVLRNGQGWGGTTFAILDPHQALVQPGGSVTYVSRLKVGSGPETIQVVVDDTNKVKEGNDSNNTGIGHLQCQPGQPVPAPPKLAPLRSVVRP